MISYETYKTLHLIFILLFFTSLGFAMNENSVFQRPKGKIIVWLVSFLIFVAGMGLVARLNMKHGEAFPFWIRSKVGGWILINTLFLLYFKIKNVKIKTLLIFLILCAGVFAIWIAIHKPL